MNATNSFRNYGRGMTILAIVFVVSLYTSRSSILFRKEDGQRPVVSTQALKVRTPTSLICRGAPNKTHRNDTHDYQIIGGKPLRSEGGDQNDETPPFWPNKVMEEYKRLHSAQALRHDESNSNRQYAILYYYCPQRAGNILHNLYNNIGWAMIHNRTILMQYDLNHSHAGTFEACNDHVLQLNEWVARYDDWGSDLPIPIPIAIDDPDRHKNKTVVIFPQIADILGWDGSIFRQEWRYDPSYEGRYNKYVLGLGHDAAIRATKMYQFGVDFLFGMFFREFFTVLVEGDVGRIRNDAHVFSLALHSRHTVVGDDGSFIPDETKCLEELLPDVRTPESCVVYFMSDRLATVKKLKEWVSDKNCSGISADTDESIESSVPLTDEMGRNQGIGFIKDLILASHARSGLIGDSGRSSYMLLQEIVEYDRRIDDWKSGRKSPKTIPHCEIPGRYGSGYDYGPGTPLFRAARRQPPLPPVQVLNLYKQVHSISATETFFPNSPASRYFVVSHLPCPLDKSIDDIYSFLNDLLFAILTNRTLVWKHVDDALCQKQAERSCSAANNSVVDCARYLKLQDWIPSSSSHQIHDYFPIINSFSKEQLAERHVITFPYSRKPLARNELSMLLGSALTNETELNMLYGNGTDFLYGMLLNEAIVFRASVLDPRHHPRIPDPSSPCLIVHVESSWNVDMDQCLQKMVPNSTSTQRCQVFWVSERPPEAIQSLRSEYKQCLHHMLNRTIVKDADVHHNGSNLQFFREMVYATDRAVSGIVFSEASSSKSHLLLERVEYLRRIAAFGRGRIPPILPILQTCP